METDLAEVKTDRQLFMIYLLYATTKVKTWLTAIILVSYIIKFLNKYFEKFLIFKHFVKILSTRAGTASTTQTARR